MVFLTPGGLGKNESHQGVSFHPAGDIRRDITARASGRRGALSPSTAQTASARAVRALGSSAWKTQEGLGAAGPLLRWPLGQEAEADLGAAPDLDLVPRQAHPGLQPSPGCWHLGWVSPRALSEAGPPGERHPPGSGRTQDEA